MPRVAHITTISLTLGFFRGHAKAAVAAGWEVLGISGPGPIRPIVPDGIDFEHHTVPLRRRIEPGHDAVSVLRLTRLLRKLKPDVVHAHTPKGGLIGMMAAAAARVPVRVYTVHGWPAATATGVKKRLLLAAEKVSCRLAHRVICVSRSVADELVASGCARPGQPVVLGEGSVDGVDARGNFDPANVPEGLREELGIPADARVLGFVGRFTRDKGIVELTRAWKGLREAYPDLWLVAVGPVLEDEDLPDGVLDVLSNDDRVVLPGMVDGMARWYAMMDVLAFPTYREGFPVVALEAQAMALPIVSCRVIGCVDAFEDGVTGTLVSAGDSIALEGAVRRYLDDPELAASHGVAARERVLEHFDPQRIRQAVLAEYDQLLRSRRR